MVDKNYFFMLSYPRSMTAWFSVFLTWGDAFCYHELKTRDKHWRNTLRKTDAKYVGMTDPGNILRYKELQYEFPDASFFCVLRDRDDVRESFRSVYENDDEIEKVMALTQRAVQKLPYSIPRYRYEDMGVPMLQSIWSHVTDGETFNLRRARRLLRMRVEATYVERV